MQKNTTLKPYTPVIQTYLRQLTPPAKNKGIRYSLAQGPSQVATASTIKEAITFNLDTMNTACSLAAKFDVQLISFPELFLSGYELKSADIAAATAHYLLEHHFYETGGLISALALKYNMAIICPLPYQGVDPAGNPGTYDAALVIDHTGTLLGVQFKTHLWGTEEYSWFRAPAYNMQKSGYDPLQNPYRIFDINGFPVGIAICYDAEFPEVARCLALNGALLTVIPTAAPVSMLSGQTEPYPDIALHCIPANALHNQNFCSYGNRASWEYSVEGSVQTQVLQYTGNSIICDPYGSALVKAVRNEDTLLIADCIICDFPSTQPPETSYLINRRPDLYNVLTAPTVPYPAGESYTYLVNQQDPPAPATLNKNRCDR